MMRTVFLATLILVISQLSLNRDAIAGVILQPVGVVSSAPHFGGDPIGNTINQVGLSAGYISGVTNFDAYVLGTTHAGAGPDTKYFTEQAALPVLITLDMGAVSDLDALAIWNANSLERIGDFEIFSDIDNDFGNGGTNSLGIFSHGGGSGTVMTHSFASTSTQFLHLEVTSSAGNPDRLEIGEFALRQSGAVPEPSSFAIFGLVALGVTLGRRRRLRRD
jgi:hypothetical protein